MARSRERDPRWVLGVHRWLSASVLALTVQCGASQQTQSTVMAPSRVNVRPEAPVVDTSEVPAPDNLVAVIRVASVRPLAQRLGQLIGVGDRLASLVENQLQRDFPTGTFDLHAPLDVAMFLSRGEPKIAVSVAAGPIDDVEARLEGRYRFVSLTNGMNRLERIQQNQGPDDLDFCVLAPTPRPSQSRIVCSPDRNAAETLAPYMSRTLTRRQVPDHTIQADLSVEILRHQYEEPIQLFFRQLEQLGQSALISDQTGPWRHGPVREVFQQLLSELMDNLRSVVQDGTTLHTSLDFAEDRVTWHWWFDARNPRGTWLRAWRQATRDTTSVPPELLTRLLPDGTYYVVATIDGRAFRPLSNTFVEIVNRVVQSEGSLPPGDVTALRQAIETVITPQRATVAVTSGANDQGDSWFVGTYQFETDSQVSNWVTGVRSLVSVLRRPAVARWFRTSSLRQLLGLSDLRDLRDLPTRGLPAGAYAFQMPSWNEIIEVQSQNFGKMFRSLFGLPTASATSTPSAASQVPSSGQANRGNARTRRALTQVILVPNGNNLLVVLGPDARALFTRVQNNNTPGIEAQFLQPQGAALVQALVPARLPAAMRTRSPNEATTLARAIARMPDQGRTPITFRVGSTEVDNLTRYTFDIEVRRETLAGIGTTILSAGTP